MHSVWKKKKKEKEKEKKERYALEKVLCVKKKKKGGRACKGEREMMRTESLYLSLLGILFHRGCLCAGGHVLSLSNGVEEAVERLADLADLMNRVHGDKLLFTIPSAQLIQFVENVLCALVQASGKLLLGQILLGVCCAIDEEDCDLLVQFCQCKLLKGVG